MRRSLRRTMPTLNASSTADISFMLLILFLVTSTINTDKGIQRQFAPIKKIEKNETTMVDKNQLCQIEITADNKINLNGKPSTKQSLRKTLLAFISKNKQTHIIEIKTDRNATYDTYFGLQNELIGIYHQLYNQTAQQRFSKAYSLCNEAQRKNIEQAIPMRVREALEIRN